MQRPPAPFCPSFVRVLPWVSALLIPVQAFAGFGAGDLVRLRRNETLLFKGESFLPAPKGQEFTVFKQEPGKEVYVAFIQKDGSVIAVTLPEAALEAVAPDTWTFLQKGSDAFRNQRFDEARKLIAQAAQDADYKPVASGLLSRVEALLVAARPALLAANEARPALASLEQKRQTAAAAGPEAEASVKALLDLQNMRLATAQKPFLEALAKGRDTAFELDGAGYASLALALDEGVDRLGAAVLGKKPDAGSGTEGGGVPSRLDRAQVLARVNRAGFSLVRCRQAMGVRRMVEASGYVNEGLAAEPAHPGLKALQAKVQENLNDAEDRYKTASANRQGRNLGQGLLALERGLKICADYPKLMELRKEMSQALEAGASPEVTPAMVAASKSATTKDALEEGRRLYTTRCVECHDLEMLDSRSASGWKNMVRSMAGKAHLKGNQESLIAEYLAAARDMPSPAKP